MAQPAAAAPSPQERQARRGMPQVKITDVKALLTAPPGLPRTVVVKIETDQPGLYGWGCATFTQRAKAVVTAVDEFLRPFLIGKNPDAIEDIWQTMYVSSYWRNGPVLYNAMSGVDQALWDIKGRRANMPVYELLGGKVRQAADVYRHASGSSPEEVEDAVRGYTEQGARHVRIQMAIAGNANYGARFGGGGAGFLGAPSGGNHDERMYEPGPYLRSLPKLFEHMRVQLGEDIELLHDIHERISNDQAMWILKRLEEYRPFFIEDPVSPEPDRLVPHLPAAVHHGDRHGRAVQLAARVRGADLGAPDRLHPRPRLADRRADPGAEAGAPVRVLRGAHGLARPRRRLARGPLGQHHPRRHQLRLWHPGGARVLRRDARGLPGMPAARERLLLAQRRAGLGHGSQRGARGEVRRRFPVRHAVRLQLGDDAAAGRVDRAALGWGASFGMGDLTNKDIGFIATALLFVLLGVSRTPLYRGFTGGWGEEDRISGREEKYVRIGLVVIGVLMLALFAYRWSNGTWVIH